MTLEELPLTADSSFSSSLLFKILRSWKKKDLITEGLHSIFQVYRDVSWVDSNLRELTGQSILERFLQGDSLVGVTDPRDDALEVSERVAVQADLAAEPVVTLTHCTLKLLGQSYFSGNFPFIVNIDLILELFVLPLSLIGRSIVHI